MLKRFSGPLRLKHLLVLLSIISSILCFQLLNQGYNFGLINLDPDVNVVSYPDNTSCLGDIKVSVSNSSFSNFEDATSIEPSIPRYYLKVSDSRGPCSTKFIVSAGYCPLSNKNCGYKPSIVDKWGVEIPSKQGQIREYSSDDSGVARIDLPSQLGEGYYFAMFKSKDNPGPNWSNKITVQINKNIPRSQSIRESINLEDYYSIEPGNTYVYRTKNNMFNRVGTTHLKIEEARKWGDFVVSPWRFTKDSEYAYWDAKNPARNGNLNIRWMVATPYVDQLYKEYIWGVGDKRYDLAKKKIEEIDKFKQSYYYVTNTSEYPAYNLGRKSLTIPYVTSYSGTTSYKSSGLDNFVPNENTIVDKSASSKGDWRIRVERARLPGYQDVIRIDFYEGVYPLETSWFHKEIWYLAKGIGLVKQQQIFYNGFGGTDSLMRNCLEDYYCFNNSTDASSHVVIELQKYYIAKKLKFDVKASAISNGRANNDFRSDLSINKVNQGYRLKLMNSDYTGYLEALVGGKSVKWLKAENGIVDVPNSVVKNLPIGSYVAKFRIWAPDELYPNETKYADPKGENIPWSNSLRVNVR